MVHPSLCFFISWQLSIQSVTIFFGSGVHYITIFSFSLWLVQTHSPSPVRCDRAQHSILNIYMKLLGEVNCMFTVLYGSVYWWYPVIHDDPGLSKQCCWCVRRLCFIQLRTANSLQKQPHIGSIKVLWISIIPLHNICVKLDIPKLLLILNSMTNTWYFK